MFPQGLGVDKYESASNTLIFTGIHLHKIPLRTDSGGGGSLAALDKFTPGHCPCSMGKRYRSPLRIPASTKSSADSLSRQKFSKVSRARRLPIKLTARTGGSQNMIAADCSRRMEAARFGSPYGVLSSWADKSIKRTKLLFNSAYPVQHTIWFVTMD